MASYRVYIRNSSAPFDGTTPEEFITLPNGETDTIYTQTGFRYQTDITSAVGRWQPPSVDRINTASMGKVNAVDAFAAGDVVQILTANNVVKEEFLYTNAGTDWFILMPDDTIAITSSTSQSCNIAISDLTWDQLTRIIQAQTIAEALFASNIQGTPIVSAANIIMTAGSSGKFTPVQMTGGAAQTLTLLPLVTASVGTTVIIFNSSGAAHNISATGADLLDGLAGVPVVSGAGTRLLFYCGGPTIGWLSH